MNRAAELFSDEAMGYSAKVPQIGGWSFDGYRVTTSLLPGMKEDLARMSGGARGRRNNGGRKTQRGGAEATLAPKVIKKTYPRTQNPTTGMMLAAQQLFEAGNGVDEVVVSVGNFGKPNVGDPTKFTTPKKGLGPFGNFGMLPGEKKPEIAPGAPVKKPEFEFDEQVGGGRRTRKMRKSRKTHKTQRGGRRTTVRGRNTFRIKFTGQIRMKQRHRQ
jgi:hypothetical protein